MFGAHYIVSPTIGLQEMAANGSIRKRYIYIYIYIERESMVIKGDTKHEEDRASCARLAGDDRELWNRRLCIGVQQLGTVPNDASILLASS